MAERTIFTPEEIETMNRTRQGTEGKTYKDTLGREYIGIRNGWIELKDPAKYTTFEPTPEIPEDNVQEAVEGIGESVDEIEDDIDEIEEDIDELEEAIAATKCFAITMATALG